MATSTYIPTGWEVASSAYTYTGVTTLLGQTTTGSENVAIGYQAFALGGSTTGWLVHKAYTNDATDASTAGWYVDHQQTAVNGLIASATAIASNGFYGYAYQETEEERAAREALEKEYALKVKKSDHRARLLFIKVAGRAAYKLLKKNGYYDVVGASGQRYRLAVGMKVRVMEGNFGDKVLHQLCAYVPDVPQVDTLLAQYLALISSVPSEEEFKKIAIKHAA